MRCVVEDSHRASAVINGIRAMYRGTATAGHGSTSNGLLREALVAAEIELRTHRVTVSIEPHDELPLVFADRGQLQQVFHNLIMNAIEAMQATSDDSRELRMRSEFVQDSARSWSRSRIPAPE